MGDLLIRNVPDVLKADLESLARRENRSRADLAREALRTGIEALAGRRSAAAASKPGDRLLSILGGVFETDEEAAFFQRDLDDIRRSDFGKPVADVE